MTTLTAGRDGASAQSGPDATGPNLVGRKGIGPSPITGPAAGEAEVTSAASLSGHRGAARFFWTVLVLATCASIGGNVTHAVLKVGGSSLVVVAAAVATVPPIVLLAALHSVGLLVRTRSAGLIYWGALVMTIGLAGCAFALSFDALWELAVSAGVRREFAWLWPLSIDVSIAQATVSLLSLNRRRGQTDQSDTAPAAQAPTPDSAAGAPSPGGSRPALIPRRTDEAIPHLNSHRPHSDTTTHALPTAAPTSSTDWTDVAETLVRDGVTTKTAAETTEALRLWEMGMAHNTIARRLGLHRDTVAKIIDGAEDLLSRAKIRA